MTTIRRRPIERQLETYEEEWKRDHDEAMACRDFEGLLVLGLGIYSAIEYAHAAWRTNVARGEEEWTAEDEQVIKDIFQRWLHVCATAGPAIAYYEEKFGVVESAKGFRETCVKAKQTLVTWQTPVLQLAPGLRSFALTDEEATRLEGLQKGEMPRLHRPPRSL